jgi:hypothetical protein
VITSENTVRRKDLCWSVRAVYVLEKWQDVSEPDLEEAGRYRMVSEPTLVVSQARVSQLRRHGAHGWSGPRVSHSIAHALALDTRTWPRGDVRGLELIDEDVGLFRG